LSLGLVAIRGENGSQKWKFSFLDKAFLEFAD